MLNVGYKSFLKWVLKSVIKWDIKNNNKSIKRHRRMIEIADKQILDSKRMINYRLVRNEEQERELGKVEEY